VTVTRNEAESRYEVTVDGEHVGLIAFRAENGVVTMLHTEVADDHEGEGIGSGLVEAALDDVRARGEKVVPTCPFVAAFIRRHTGYQDLVAS
jgi:uncharacterized protein